MAVEKSVYKEDLEYECQSVVQAHDLVTLTAQRYSHDLEKCLLETITRLFPGPAFDLLQLVDIGQDRFELIPLHNSDGAMNAEACRSLSYRVVEYISGNLIIDEPVYQEPAAGNEPGYILLPCGDHSTQILINKSGHIKMEYLHGLHILCCVYCNCYIHINNNIRDMLTGLLNRKSFYERVNEIYASLRREELSQTGAQSFFYTLAVIDIDNFKQINDSFGHIIGDETLILLAKLLQDNFRANDLLFRFGGEEFVVILGGSSEEGLITALQRLQENIRNFTFPQIKTLTVSIGYVYINHYKTINTLFAQADRALYYVKQNGRNSINGYDELLHSGKIMPIKASDDIELF